MVRAVEGEGGVTSPDMIPKWDREGYARSFCTTSIGCMVDGEMVYWCNFKAVSRGNPRASIREMMARAMIERFYEKQMHTNLGLFPEHDAAELVDAALLVLTQRTATDAMIEAGHKVNAAYSQMAGGSAYTVRGAVSHVFEAMVEAMIAEA